MAEIDWLNFVGGKIGTVFQNEISFDFKTSNPQGMLLSIGDPARDFIRVYMLGGIMYWTYRLGAGEMGGWVFFRLIQEDDFLG